MLAGRIGHDDVVIRGARLLDPVEGVDATLDVRVDAGVIAEIGDRLEANGHRVVEAAGLTLVPAFIDPHVHLRTPGREDEETIESGTAAAAAGGYCAILAIPNTDPVVDNPDVLRGLQARAEAEAHVPVGFLAAITRGQDGAELTEMAALAQAGAAGFTDDGRPVVSAGVMRRALQYSAVAGRTLAVHCEEPTLTRGGHAHAGAVAAQLGIGGWPSLGESLMVSRDVDLAAETRRPVHLMHLSARESVDHLRRAHALGAPVSAEATPHHLCLTEEAVRTLDANMKMNPPLRTDADRAALIEAVRDGTIAAIATDHAPHAPEEKDVPFESAPFGVIGLETAFAALYTHLVEPGLLRLETLIERMSAGPAAIFGLERPRIAVGARANVTLLDTNATWNVTSFRSRSSNSWLVGERLRGRVALTVANGTMIDVGSTEPRRRAGAALAGAGAGERR
jgi:dihydroorotase